MRRNQSGLALKPLIFLLVILGGMGFYIMKDLQKIKKPAGAKKAAVASQAQEPAVAAPVPPPAPVAAPVPSTGQVCGVARYKCAATTSALNPSVTPGPAVKLEGTACPGQEERPLNCVFVDASEGFRLDGTPCSDGSVPVTHPGQLVSQEFGEGDAKTGTLQQTLLVLCVRQ